MEDNNMDSTLEKKITEECRLMKLKTLGMGLGAGSSGSHIGGAFSVTEIVNTLIHFANIPHPASPERDRIILSKGHGAMALYTALWQRGILSEEDLDGFDKNGSGMYGHPHRNLSKGIEFSAGSLGLGLSYAVGVAYSLKERSLNNHVYAIVGDGECNEGIVWEACMSASNFHLDNLTVIVDKNGWQLDGPTDEVMNTTSLENKFKAFGFSVIPVDGHHPQELWKALSEEVDLPKVIIANTVKANGISFLENTRESHHCVLTKKKYQMAVDDVNKYYDHE